MDDLISRQRAIAVADSSDYVGLSVEDCKKVTDEVVKGLKQLPSVQPEQTKGKWIHDGYDFPHGIDWIHCSICGKKGINVPADLTNFCPNCGADMRETDGSED